MASDPGPPACDLVMKGGITSGVVYPSAVRTLSESYEFRSIGGASAGAIAAAVTAAAEFGKRTGRGGYGELEALTEELAEPGFLRGLFQPSPQTRPTYELLLRLAARGGSPLGRLVELLGTVLVRAWWISVPVVALGVALLQIVADGTGGGWRPVGVVLALAAVMGAILAAASASLLVLASRFRRGIEANGFGICSGMPERGSAGRALTEWLHEKIQRAAGLDPHRDPPLTFRGLREVPGEPIELRLVTTDLSYGRPVILPVERRSYLVRREDLVPLFPSPVVEYLWERGEVPDFVEHISDEDPRGYRFLPDQDLPVLVAARLSLSFPVLITAVRLWSYNALTGGLLENWFSDGGISSNFPIHFFDALIPGHPTFGLDLQPRPGPGAPEVHMPARPTDLQRPRWRGVAGLGGFLRQIADVMQNWRDTMQTELPGSRDRVCQIRLEPGEGGLNVAMPPAAIRNLLRKGEVAGRTIRRTFDRAHWRRHQFTRYLTAMQRLQAALKGVERRFEEFGPFLAEGAPGVDVYRECHDAAWCRSAAGATEEFLGPTRRWGQEGEIDFFMDRDCAGRPDACPHCEPEPAPVLRIVPNV
jgi:predicted acylesterase/phospholipase RssA